MLKSLIASTIALTIGGTTVVAAAPSQNVESRVCSKLDKRQTWIRVDVIEAVRSGHLVEVLQVIDGDTFWARVHRSDDSCIDFKVRLRRIDAPELMARCVQEREWALDAFFALDELLDDGDLEFHAVGRDKYPDRIVATVSTLLTPDVSIAMVESGHAREYLRGRRLSWCE